MRQDHALATIVLAVEPSLFYLIGDPEDPTTVWEKLQAQFQKNTWVNKLAPTALFTVEGWRFRTGSLKYMMKLFSKLAIVGDVIEEKD